MTFSNRVYDELGIKPVIHAAGTITSFGGSMPRSEVIEAMALASTSFVGLIELNEKVGEYIAQVTGAEAGMVVSGAAGGGLVSVTLTGKGDMRAIKIAPSRVVAEEVEVLEDLVTAAFNDAKAKVEAHMQEEMAKATGGLNLPPGMNLPF